MLTLIGILIVVAGFALRLNPLLVVTVAGLGRPRADRALGADLREPPRPGAVCR